MPLPVELKAVVDQMEFGTDDWRAYINRKTGELASFPGDVLSAAEEEADDEEEASGAEPDWDREMRQECRSVLEDKDFIQLPTQYDIHEYDIMKRFCRSRPDDGERGLLLDAIAGRGAFRMFKSTIHRRGIEQEWYRYRDAALRQIAVEFLEAHGIPYVDDAAGGEAQASS
jgi:5'-3' exonuclease